MKDKPFNAHYRCTHCHAVRAKNDVIFVDDVPICNKGDCKNEYYKKTRPGINIDRAQLRALGRFGK